MALERLLLTYNHGGQRMAPNSIRGPLHTIVAAGGPAIQDGATIDRPDTQIVHVSRRIVELDITGTYLALILGYDQALTDTTPPRVKLFGRVGKQERWELLRNLSEDLSAELVPGDGDVSDGTLRYTTISTARNVWDVGRVNEIIVGVEIPLAGSGSVGNSIIQARLWG